MNVDLSPDGATIVFDLLGDIYTMPASGSADGSAVTCIASGHQWDMQPRFSPDGLSIAFVSDRTGDNGKGGDNVWVMKKDGTEVRQVTRESFRLLTQPIWTRDGESIIARKHFTSRRSLGSGEMWQYHASGKTDGLALTTKPSDQKDVGEPALSPDGRYLYYSLDATPGASFEYGKDSTRGIYAVDRLDLQKGETTRLIAGPGGACRPTPSPDGKSIAFVRRVRYRTTLFVLDLANGAARSVFDGLERDNQETWAVHGVAPPMVWTPDGRSIITWAGGKIRRVDVAAGSAGVIPFRVKGTRTVTSAQRFAVEAAPATFDVRMLRTVSVNPADGRSLFQALGGLYTGPSPVAPDAAVTRLTTGAADEGAFYPAWSRDGKRVVYVAWNDERLSVVRVLDVASGTISTITPEPGHFVTPAFSPDGATVVYAKVTGGYLTSPLWGREPGIYAAPVPGPGQTNAEGAPRLLSRRGADPHFGADGGRVFYSVNEGGSDSDRAMLMSIGLDAREERTHYKSDWATEYRVSPDGRWMAFAERYNVFVTPFVKTGRTVDIGPKAAGTPVVKVSGEAGANLGWTGDSSRVTWSLGPTIYAQDVRGALQSAGFVAGGAPAPPAVAAVSQRVDLKAAQDVPTGQSGGVSVIALTNARLLTMEDADRGGPTGRGMRVIERGTVVIEGNRIKAAGPVAETAVPTGAKVIDATGCTIMPGLIDVHAHGSQGENGFTPRKNWIALANLAFGVTTIHDPSNDTESIFAAAELARTGALLAPRTFSTGTILYGAAGAYKAELESLDDALFHLSRMKAVGAFSVKSYNQPRRDQRQMVLEAARRLKMMVVPEGGALFMHNMTMVADGHTSVEHTLPVENIYADVRQFWGASQTGYTPTLGVAYGGMEGERYWYATTNVWENARLMNFVPRYVVDPRSRRREVAPAGDWNHIKEAAVAHALMQVGVRPTLGAHGQLAGLAAHWELAMFVQGGMTPAEALRAGTIDGAWYIGLDNDLGSITPGKLADLIVLDKDPSADIAHSQSIRQVVLNGRVYDAMTMAEVAPRAGERPVMFFESLQRGSATPMALEAIMRHAAGCAGCGRAGCQP
ncbi:MAG: amidohydrolase family protein [Phycisphaerales bacterium]